MTLRRHRFLSWACGILILTLWASSHYPWHGAQGLLYGKYSTGWTWTYDASKQGAEAYGLPYFLGGSFLLLLAGMWMLIPQFRASKLEPAPWPVPLISAILGWLALFRWYPSYTELVRYYKEETSNALHVVGHTGLFVAAVSTFLLTIFAIAYGFVRRERPLPPPPPPPPSAS